jgi:glycosyltransferase involved in cell wall biosynthesis
MIPAAFPAAVFPNKKLEYFWNLKEKAALWQADRIITVSDFSRKQIVKLRGVRDEKIGVVSEAPGEAFELLPAGEERRAILSRFGLKPEERFLLYVGGISPHKNLQSLMRVFCKLTSTTPGYKLVLAGDYEKDSFFSDFSELSELAKNLQMKDHVVFTGYVNDSELAHLYNSAALFVLPSLQEGFGLSAVEAMACGTPIVASRAGSLPEITGDAAEFFDPENLEEMLQAITRCLMDPTLRQNLRERGLKRAASFQWSRGASELLTIFHSMERR